MAIFCLLFVQFSGISSQELLRLTKEPLYARKIKFSVLIARMLLPDIVT